MRTALTLGVTAFGAENPKAPPAEPAVIMRHCGSSYTLHNSYRGLRVTQEEGAAYFEIMPKPVAHPVRPGVFLHGAALARARPVRPKAGSRSRAGAEAPTPIPAA